MTNENTGRNQPSHAVYIVEGEGETTYWTKIGAAWPHTKDDGFNIQLSALPLTGKLVIMKRQPKQQGGQGQ
jgi:hypothetical protein